MSILTGAELGGGLPPPRIGTSATQTDHETETPGRAIPFSSEAAILQLTDNAARIAVQGGQELLDRRSEQNAAEKEEARRAAAEEARQRSLEEQGLKEPENAADQALVNAAAKGENSEVNETIPVGPSFDSEGTPAVAAQPSAAPQPAEVTDDRGRLDVVA